MARKMKDSGIEWIGEIPEGWELTKVKRIFDIGRGRVISQQELTSVGYPVYSSQTKNNGCLGYISTYDFDKSQLTWTTDGVNAGTVFLREGKHNCTNVCGTLAPKNDTNDLRYLKYALEYIAFYHKRADINGFKIMNNEMAEIELLLPPLFEQKNIANYLDFKCSQTQSILEQSLFSIEEYKKLKQAVITQAVTKGVCGEREMKDSGVEWIGEIPKYWNIGKLKYSWISVESGVSVNAADRPIDNPAQYGVLKTSSVSKFIFNPHEHKQVNNDEYSRVTCPVTADCIIVSRMNTPDLVGACGYVEKTYPNLFLPDRLWQISFKNDVSAKFIWYYLNNKMVRSYISSLSTGTSSTMQNISQGQFGNISVCLPDSNEQKEIADYLDAKCAEIDKLIAKKEQLVKELESYKKSLIYEVVTGKREV